MVPSNSMSSNSLLPTLNWLAKSHPSRRSKEALPVPEGGPFRPGRRFVCGAVARGTSAAKKAERLIYCIDIDGGC